MLIKEIIENKFSILWSIFLGIFALFLSNLTGLHIMDPLVVGLVLGICFRSIIRFDQKTKKGFSIVPSIFLPIGIIFYGAVNLNFVRFSSIDIEYTLTLIMVMLSYIISAIFFSNVFDLKEKVGFLVTAGSAICGASAIAITSKTIDAEPDDVSVSLISIFITALIGLFLIIPLVVHIFGLDNIQYGFLAGSVMQFTGFVKASVANMPSEVRDLAVSVKAVRYMGLLFLLPLFSSFSKDRFYMPWYLWAFFLSGLVFTFLPDLAEFTRPVFKIILDVLWTVSMAAIGLNADAKVLFRRNTFKVFAVSMLSFLVAVGVFLLGIFAF